MAFDDIARTRVCGQPQVAWRGNGCWAASRHGLTDGEQDPSPPTALEVGSARRIANRTSPGPLRRAWGPSAPAPNKAPRNQDDQTAVSCDAGHSGIPFPPSPAVRGCLNVGYSHNHERALEMGKRKEFPDSRHVSRQQRRPCGPMHGRALAPGKFRPEYQE